MFAPCFPYDTVRHPNWHKVHPLNLSAALCNTAIILNCVLARDDVPAEETYCARCSGRQLSADRTPQRL